MKYLISIILITSFLFCEDVGLNFAGKRFVVDISYTLKIKDSYDRYFYGEFHSLGEGLLKIKLSKDGSIWIIPVENIISIENTSKPAGKNYSVPGWMQRKLDTEFAYYKALYGDADYVMPEYYDIKNDPVEKIKPDSNKVAIAVSNFKTSSLSVSELSALIDRLGLELFDTGRFKVIERESIDLLLSEQGFQQSGCTTTQCLIEIGKIINVKMIVTGSVNKVGTIYSANAKMINVETGEIVKMAKYDHTGDIGGLLLKGIPHMALNLSNY